MNYVTIDYCNRDVEVSFYISAAKMIIMRLKNKKRKSDTKRW